MTTFIIIGGLIFVGLFIYVTNSRMNLTLKEFDIIKDLEKKSLTLSTKEDIVEFYTEFREKSLKINNPNIKPRLARIDGYLHGLYKNAKQ